MTQRSSHIEASNRQVKTGPPRLIAAILMGLWSGLALPLFADDHRYPSYTDRPIGAEDRPQQSTTTPRWNNQKRAPAAVPPRPPVISDTSAPSADGLHDGRSAEAPGKPEREQAMSAVGPTVIGRIIYRGTVPNPIELPVDRDTETCGKVMSLAPLSVDPVTHGVRDVVVRVAPSNSSGGTPAQPQTQHVTTVENKGCHFLPRVAPVLAGSTAELRNADSIMHNTNMMLGSRTVMNVALVANANPIRKPLERIGLHLVKCNVHKFMQAYRIVFPDQYFDQTGASGQFRIAGLPPGRHTISAWHETLGTVIDEVQVPSQGTVTVELEFHQPQ